MQEFEKQIILVLLLALATRKKYHRGFIDYCLVSKHTIYVFEFLDLLILPASHIAHNKLILYIFVNIPHHHFKFIE